MRITLPILVLHFNHDYYQKSFGRLGVAESLRVWIDKPEDARVQTPPGSAELIELWAKLIETLGRVSPFMRAYLVDATPVSFEKKILVIGFGHEFEQHIESVGSPRHRMMLGTVLAELGYPNCQIKFVRVSPKH